MEISMSGEVCRLGEKMGEHIVRELSKRYGFSSEEALEYLNMSSRIETVEVKKEIKKTSIPLPFCGKICPKNCEAIRLNHGLYTQCTNEKAVTSGSHNVCLTCSRQIDKNSNKMPTYGYISERVEKGADFRDPKGKAPVNYGNVMEKLNISRNDAEREAANRGVIIPEDQFTVKKARRGRPKKDTTAVDTSGSEEETPKSEKKRGRPKKDREVVGALGDDLIKDLLKSVNTPAQREESPSSDPIDDDDDDDDEGTTEVSPFIFKGKKYLKSADNTVYDCNTWDEIGKFNPESETIEDIVSDED